MSRGPTLEVSCEQFAAGIVTDYMEADLDAFERGLVERHLAGCDGCAGVLERMRAISELLGGLDPPEPAPVTPGLMTRFRGWARERGTAAEPARSRRSA